MITLRVLIKRLHLRTNILGISLFLLALSFAAFLYYRNGKNGVFKTPVDYVKHPLVIELPVHYELDLDMGLEIRKIENMNVTCYNNLENQTDKTPNITATGRIVYQGSCAVSQDLFKKSIYPGDIVYVAKLKRYLIVEDTMNVRHINHLDIFMFKKHLKKAQEFGLQKSDVYVIRVRR